jgi:hypothetical protein
LAGKRRSDGDERATSLTAASVWLLKTPDVRPRARLPRIIEGYILQMIGFRLPTGLCAGAS